MQNLSINGVDRDLFILAYPADFKARTNKIQTNSMLLPAFILDSEFCSHFRGLKLRLQFIVVGDIIVHPLVTL